MLDLLLHLQQRELVGDGRFEEDVLYTASAMAIFQGRGVLMLYWRSS